jgi:hypothetical protein
MDTSKIIRNKYNQALINTDSVSYKKFASEQQQSREIKKALVEVNSLRSDVEDIKGMLRTIINGMNNNGKSSS